MYGSPSMSKDLNLPFPVSPFKQGKEDPDIQRQKQQPHVSSSGLLRYRSAPGNVLGEVCDETVAAESMFARFMGPDLRDHLGGSGSGDGEKHQSTDEVAVTGEFRSSDPPHMFFHSSLQHQQHQQMTNNMSLVGSDVVEREGGSVGNLVRHSSSPVGFLSHSNAENGFAGIRSMPGFNSPAGNGEARTNSGRLNGQISFSSRQGPTSGLVSQHISELGSEGLDRSSPDEGGSSRCYIPGYPIGSLGDSVPIPDNFAAGRKRIIRDPSETQNVEMRNHVPTLTHHFSLPKTSTEMAAMERIMQFQDFVPCKIRAKRGCATHPRSVAERVRRTRISERMRKLQELVPNMDKQTNTADMLDFAVDYIKDLQVEAKMLTENRAKCTCSNK